ncbi:hypothetical protein BDP27DRAFT_1400413 [Rhodocollybia butyracea]|uniref:Uncharacterized protein n=1 Tax=Rhodocollybia butyracea TaxID=206335 RepID=A0A9P5UBP5_9AGAR|nr:hypothetical protein BDP27DRAFT_1400413 [Rhodocollybia butyracea]
MTTLNSKFPTLAEQLGVSIYDNLISLILNSVLYGIFIALVLVSTSGFLIPKTTANTSGHAYIIIFCCISITVATMTLNVIVPLGSLLSYVSAMPEPSSSYLIWTRIGYPVPLLVMIIVSDFIVSWRACVMWPFSRYIKAIFMIFMMTNIIFQCLWALSYMSARVVQGILVLGFNSHWPTLLLSNALGLITSLVINILGTLLIGVKAWLHRRDMRVLGFRRKRLTKSQHVLILWIECGLGLCVLQVAYMAIQLAKAGLLASPGGVIGPSQVNSLRNRLVAVIPSLVGLYLIIVSLIVKLKLSAMVGEEMSLQTITLSYNGRAT